MTPPLRTTARDTCPTYLHMASHLPAELVRDDPRRTRRPANPRGQTPVVGESPHADWARHCGVDAARKSEDQTGANHLTGVPARALEEARDGRDQPLPDQQHQNKHHPQPGENMRT